MMATDTTLESGAVQGAYMVCSPSQSICTKCVYLCLELGLKSCLYPSLAV